MTGRLRIPAEWERHEACWLGFPHLAAEWPQRLEAAQRAIAELCRAIAGPGEEAVRLLVPGSAVERTARHLIGDAAGVEFVRADYGDCWLRDTGPLFGLDAEGNLGALQFVFNGWGGKYRIPFDDELAEWLTARVEAVPVRSPFVLEGGALEVDGRGTVLTTASCVLNDNRNPGLTREQFEDGLSDRIEVDRVVWLERGLEHDHTDGHVDMIARFVSSDTVLCMESDSNAPNAEVLESVASSLRHHGFALLALPAPSEVRSPTGAPLPASYCNFYVANGAVIVPTYGIGEDRRALDVLAGAFPTRDVIGLHAYDLLCGGGAFHCVTQPQPAPP